MKTVWQHDQWTWHGWWHVPDGPVEEVVIAFHGFGRGVEEMLAFLPLFNAQTAMLSVGLCHHNGSTPPPDGAQTSPLSPKVFQQALAAWTAELLPNGHPRIPQTMLGYSLGGRIAMALFENAPERWVRLVLLAPDGFKKNPMYQFAVETAFGRWTWRWCDRHADFVQSVIRACRRWRILPEHLAHFALHHTQDETMRKLVSNTWFTHQHFWPSRKKSSLAWQQAEGRGVVVDIVFGLRDAIIPWSWSKAWRTPSMDHVHFLTVDAGHVMRHPETVDDIKEAILVAHG